MTILMLADSMVRGGSERRLTELLKGLSKFASIRTELVVFSDKIQYPELYELPTRIHVIKRRTKKDFSALKTLYALCRKIKPDILHAWGSMAAIYALPVRWFQPVKFINGMITDAPIFKGIEHRYLRFKLTAPFSDVILANSHAGLNSYHAPLTKSRVIYNGYDFNRNKNTASGHEIRKRYGISNEKIVGMVGAFEERKDYFTFIKIAIQILSQRDDVIFMAIGDGSQLEICKEIVQREKLHRFIFTGRTEDAESIIQIFDIGILISNTKVHGEGISNAIMEYMAAQKPVIANDNGGNAEIIEDSTTGFLLNNPSIQQWSDSINFLLDDDSAREKMGWAGYLRIQSRFEINRMIKEYLTLYENVNNETVS